MGTTHSILFGSPEAQFLRLEFGEMSDADPEPYRWVDTLISVKAGGFTGTARATLLAQELRSLLADLRQLGSELAGEVTFSTIEGQVGFVLRGTSMGELTLDGHMSDDTGGHLQFTLALDQTYLPPVIRALGAFVQGLA